MRVAVVTRPPPCRAWHKDLGMHIFLCVLIHSVFCLPLVAIGAVYAQGAFLASVVLWCFSSNSSVCCFFLPHVLRHCQRLVQIADRKSVV